MTPEERYEKWERTMEFLLEQAAVHDAQIAELREFQKATTTQFRETDARINRLADAQELTEERLLILIEHVDGHEARLKRMEGRK